MSKLNNLRDAASSRRWDIIWVTETHLLSLIPDLFVAIPEYILVCHDASQPRAKHGVSIYVDRCIIIDSLTILLLYVISIHLSSFTVYCLLMY